MDIKVTKDGETTVVAPDGDLDMAVADQFRRALTDLIDRNQTRLLLDLGRVAYIDSSSLGALVAALKHCRRLGGDIRLCDLQPDVRAVFEMTRLVKILEIYGSRREAIAAWGSRPLPWPS